MDNTCTLNLFGISESPCDCYTDALNGSTDPNWYKKSTSGLYLDELEPEGLVSMRTTQGSLTCDKTLGQFYKEAIQQAIKRTCDDAFTLVSERYKSKRATFSGHIGGKRFDRGFNISGAAIAGVILSPYPIIDGVFSLQSINIGSYLTRNNLVLSIYKHLPNSNEEPVLVQNVEGLTTVSGRVTTKVFDEPIRLPLEDDGEPVEYLFVYPMQAGEALANTSVSCGCGKKEAIFNSYARFQGVTIKSDAPDLSYFDRTSGSSYGISLDGSFACDGSSIVCRMFETSANWKTVFAYAARYLAAALVNERIYKSQDLTHYTMANYDEIKASAFNFRGEYQSRLTWLSQNADPSVNDCFTCDTTSMRRATILR